MILLMILMLDASACPMLKNCPFGAFQHYLYFAPRLFLVPFTYIVLALD